MSAMANLFSIAHPNSSSSAACPSKALLIRPQAPGPSLRRNPRQHCAVHAHGRVRCGCVGVMQARVSTGWGICQDVSKTHAKITKSDEAFAAEGLEFVRGCEGINLDSLNALFTQVNFPRRDPTRLQLALENTYFVLWIRYTKSSRFAKKGQILGFARVLSDGVFYASIWDVAVFPSWQRLGLGRALIERLVSQLVHDGIPIISLYAERDVIGLYEKLGFKKDPEGVTGMAYAVK